MCTSHYSTHEHALVHASSMHCALCGCACTSTGCSTLLCCVPVTLRLQKMPPPKPLEPQKKLPPLPPPPQLTEQVRILSRTAWHGEGRIMRAAGKRACSRCACHMFANGLVFRAAAVAQRS